MGDDFEREREDYIARASQGQSALGQYYGQRHPASLPGRAGRVRTTRSDFVNAVLFLVVVVALAFVAVVVSVLSKGRVNIPQLMSAVIPLALVVLLFAAVFRVRRRRAREFEEDEPIHPPHGRSHHHPG